MSIHVTEEHLAIAQKLVDKAHANNGLAPVDLERFWSDQRLARANPFGEDIPQAAFGAILNWECVFAELGIEQTWARYNRDVEWRLSLSKAYNDKSEVIVGRRLLSENRPDPKKPGYPSIKALHDVFDMENRWDDISQAYWLQKGANNADELAELLDLVDRRLENLPGCGIPFLE